MPHDDMNIPVIVELYEHKNFEGRKVVLVESTPDLNIFSAGEWASSIKIRRGPNYNPDIKYEVSFYSEPNASAYYAGGGKGAQLVLGLGNYPNLNAPYNFDDTIRCVGIGQGITPSQPFNEISLVVELYEGPNCQGRKAVIVGKQSDWISLAEYDFDCKVGSARCFRGPDYVKKKVFARLTQTFGDPNPDKAHIDLILGKDAKNININIRAVVFIPQN